jgi:hypothetical protein
MFMMLSIRLAISALARRTGGEHETHRCQDFFFNALSLESRDEADLRYRKVWFANMLERYPDIVRNRLGAALALPVGAARIMATPPALVYWRRTLVPIALSLV